MQLLNIAAGLVLAIGSSGCAGMGMHGAPAAHPSGQERAECEHVPRAGADCPPAAEQQKQHEHGETPPT